jgi:FkbM family methyltransferase
MIMNKDEQRDLIENIFATLPRIRQLHNVNNPLFTLLHREIESYFTNRSSEKILTHPFENVLFPRASLGNFNSDVYLHALEEFVIRSFYVHNKNCYKTFFDIGSNTGFDTVLAASLGWHVNAFEPDPENYAILQDNIRRNGFSNVQLHCKALSDTVKDLSFVHVKGNTTASHIAGVRNYYGDADFFSVPATTFKEIGFFPDLIKMNIEAFEKIVIRTIPMSQWEKMDCFVALHDDDNRNAIYNHFVDTEINIFSQKIGWEKALRTEDMALEKEGYIFISAKKIMPW